MTSSVSNNKVSCEPLRERARTAFGHGTMHDRSIGLAVSGGSDSMALLALAAHYRETSLGGVHIHAVTVDHGLRPEAAAEARFVARACAKLGVDHDVVKWRRKDTGPVSQAEARKARHVLLAQWAQKQDIDTVALGHTRDDRIETFLMRARQGSGWRGLAGPMPSSHSPVWPEGNGLPLIRPLLAFGREELRDYLRAQGIAWIEDPSNDSSRFERVRMRRLLERMDAGAKAKALKVMDRLMAMRAAVMEEASSLLTHVKTDFDDGTADVLLQAREGVGGEAWLMFLEAMVMAAGGAPGPPPRDGLERLAARIASREPTLARGVTLGGARIHIRDGAFLTFAQAPPRRGQPERDGAHWSRAEQLLEPPNLGMMSV